MRTLKQFMLFVMVSTMMSLTSCSSDDDGGNSGGNGGGGGNGGSEHVTAKVDGTDFAAAQDPAVIVGAQSTNGILVVQGGQNNGNTISITIQNYTGVGTYTAGDALTNNNLMQYLTVSPVAGWISSGVTSIVGINPGTIEVTSDDGTTVEGTFSFEGYNGDDMTTKVITEGSFKANFD